MTSCTHAFYDDVYDDLDVDNDENHDADDVNMFVMNLTAGHDVGDDDEDADDEDGDYNYIDDGDDDNTDYHDDDDGDDDYHDDDDGDTNYHDDDDYHDNDDDNADDDIDDPPEGCESGDWSSTYGVSATGTGNNYHDWHNWQNYHNSQNWHNHNRHWCPRNHISLLTQSHNHIHNSLHNRYNHQNHCNHCNHQNHQNHYHHSHPDLSLTFVTTGQYSTNIGFITHLLSSRSYHTHHHMYDDKYDRRKMGITVILQHLLAPIILIIIPILHLGTYHTYFANHHTSKHNLNPDLVTT